MTDRRAMTEGELDALLGRWLGSGAVDAADRVVERAMRRVATVPQEGARLRGIGTVFGRAPLAWAAVAGAALLIGIGLFLGRGLVGDTSSPSPSAEESDAPPSTRQYMRFGLQLDVPAAWTATTHPHETSFSGEFTVREGSMSGEILTCDTPAGPWQVLSARLASSCSRNGIKEAATETICFGETSM